MKRLLEDTIINTFIFMLASLLSNTSDVIIRKTNRKMPVVTIMPHKKMPLLLLNYWWYINVMHILICIQIQQCKAVCTHTFFLPHSLKHTQKLCHFLTQTPVPKFVLEDRLAMYFQAIDHATAASDSQRTQLLEKDIQVCLGEERGEWIGNNYW